MYLNKARKRVTAMLLVALLLMTVGFAVLEQQLNITGTSRIDSRWDVRITGITSTPTGEAENAENPSFTNTTASFKVNLANPGDVMEYDITVKNNGTMDAVLSSINKTDGNNSAISFTYSGIRKNGVLKAGESTVLKVTVKYNNVALDLDNLSSDLTITLNYKQNNPNNADYVIQSTGDYVIDTAQTSTTSGLVSDDVEVDNYLFKGAAPENYITFNNEVAGWRIMSVDADGTIKIIRNTSIGNISWDEAKTRDVATSTYCTYASDYGCNAWAATKNLGLAENANFVQYEPNGNKNSDTTKYEGTVIKDASLNTYLNTTYYNGLTDIAKGQIISHDFYISTPGSSTDTEGIMTDSEQIKDYVWNGKIVLMTAVEYMKGSTNDTCSSLSSAFDFANSDNCGTNNWLKAGIYEWTLSPYVNYSNSSAWLISDTGCLGYNLTYLGYGVRPVLYLSSTLKLEGNGTVDDPYTIINAS